MVWAGGVRPSVRIDARAPSLERARAGRAACVHACTFGVAVYFCTFQVKFSFLASTTFDIAHMHPIRIHNHIGKQEEDLLLPGPHSCGQRQQRAIPRAWHGVAI